jgi:hypothetical protein
MIILSSARPFEDAFYTVTIAFFFAYRVPVYLLLLLKILEASIATVATCVFFSHLDPEKLFFFIYKLYIAYINVVVFLQMF